MRRGNNIFQFFPRKDVGGGEVSLSVTVLPGLGRRNAHHLITEGQDEEKR